MLYIWRYQIYQIFIEKLGTKKKSNHSFFVNVSVVTSTCFKFLLFWLIEIAHFDACPLLQSKVAFYTESAQYFWVCLSVYFESPYFSSDTSLCKHVNKVCLGVCVRVCVCSCVVVYLCAYLSVSTGGFFCFHIFLSCSMCLSASVSIVCVCVSPCFCASLCLPVYKSWLGTLMHQYCWLGWVLV